MHPGFNPLLIVSAEVQTHRRSRTPRAWAVKQKYMR